MDTSELHYVTYDPDAIWDAMLNAYMDAGGELLYPGDEKEMLMRSVLADITQVFAGIDNGLRMQTLRYAVGEYLDLIGEMRSCERIQARAATATVTIQTNATGQLETLPAGTMMTADGEVFYALINDLELSGYAQPFTAQVMADRTGTVGNGLVAGTQMQMQKINPAVNSIVVSVGATGGQDAEDDDTYRERIRAHGLANVTTGPARQYEAAAMAVSSVILDAKAINLGDGEVGVYLMLSDDTGAEALIQAVTEALNADNVRPLTDTVSVSQATDVDYKLIAAVEAPGSVSRADLNAAAAEYQAWQEGKIGRPFNPDRLVAALYQAGASRVRFSSSSHFNGETTIQYTEIDETERCKGEVSLSSLSS